MGLHRLTFRLLQVYLSVLDCGSMSEAARRLHLTQPTVSQQLKRLGETAGMPLIESRHGRLVATEAGEELAKTGRELLARLEACDRHLLGLRDGVRGHIRVAMVNTAQYILPRLLGPYSQRHPDVDLTVHVGNREQVLARFDRQDDDLYVFSHPPASPQALAGRFLRNPLVVVAPRGHPQAQDDNHPLRFSELAGERFLLREPGSATRMLFERWLREQGQPLARGLLLASNEAIRVGVAAGMGLAVLSEHVLTDNDQGLVVLPVQGFPIQSHWQFVVHRERRLPPAAQRFLRYVAANLPTWIPPRFLANDLPGLLAQLDRVATGSAPVSPAI